LHDEFLKRLFAKIDGRKQALADGSAPPESWAVPGTHELLRALRDRGAALYLVSGTEYGDVIEEMRLLKFDEFFGDRVYAPKPGQTSFHKRAAIATVLRDEGLRGEDLIGFGDGYSETVEVLAAGGRAVGVASVEVGQSGPCPRKSALLREWGADPIVPDYRDAVGLVARLWGDG
jgi:phosphoglycolate phosphatase-like HAD superfamily hydrolase